ncbi:MAG TPA: dihydrofolate reductase family protein [Solirubrobacterales bacterium]|nr:dihydrofolate reductase family protein [Solirubrobacterales bacterium]
MQRLIPDPGPTTIGEQMAGFDPRSAAGQARPYVYTNFASTIDGHATIGGVSGKIGSATDTAMLMALRESADAVLIGAGTMRVERYGRLLPQEEARERRAAAGLEPDPVTAIVTAGLDLPWDAGLFTSGAGEVVIFTSSGGRPPEVATPVEVIRSERSVELGTALATLRGRGARAVLSEGGPTLHGRLLAEGLVDELFLTFSPRLGSGGGPRIVEGLAGGPIDLELRWLLAEGSELFARYATRS